MRAAKEMLVFSSCFLVSFGIHSAKGSTRHHPRVISKSSCPDHIGSIRYCRHGISRRSKLSRSSFRATQQVKTSARPTRELRKLKSYLLTVTTSRFSQPYACRLKLWPRALAPRRQAKSSSNRCLHRHILRKRKRRATL